MKNKKTTLTIIAIELVVIGILFLIIGYKNLMRDKAKSVVNVSMGTVTMVQSAALGEGPEGGLGDGIYTSACSYRVQSA